MPQDFELLRSVAEHCWSSEFLDVFHKFFNDYAEDFIDAPETMEGGEHDLHYDALFRKYLKVYEEALEVKLTKMNVDLEAFQAEVMEFKENQTDFYLSNFVRCLLASMDYDSFYRVMAKEGKKKRIERDRADQKVAPKLDLSPAKSGEGEDDKADSKASYDDLDGGDEGAKSDDKYGHK